MFSKKPRNPEKWPSVNRVPSKLDFEYIFYFVITCPIISTQQFFNYGPRLSAPSGTWEKFKFSGSISDQLNKKYKSSAQHSVCSQPNSDTHKILMHAQVCLGIIIEYFRHFIFLHPQLTYRTFIFKEESARVITYLSNPVMLRNNSF